MDAIREFFEFKHGAFLDKLSYARESYKILVDALKNDGFEVAGNKFHIPELSLRPFYRAMVTSSRTDDVISLTDRVIELAKQTGFEVGYDVGIEFIHPYSGYGKHLARPATTLAEAKNFYDAILRDNIVLDKQHDYKPVENSDIKFLEISGRNDENCKFKIMLMSHDVYNTMKDDMSIISGGNMEIYPSENNSNNKRRDEDGHKSHRV